MFELRRSTVLREELEFGIKQSSLNLSELDAVRARR